MRQRRPLNDVKALSVTGEGRLGARSRRSIGFDVRGANHLAPLRYVGLEEFAELSRGHADRDQTKLPYARPQGRVLQGRAQRIVNGFEHDGREGGGAEQTVPSRDVEVRHAFFL